MKVNIELIVFILSIALLSFVFANKTKPKPVRTIQRYHESNLAITVLTDGQHEFLVVDNGDDLEIREF